MILSDSDPAEPGGDHGPADIAGNLAAVRRRIAAAAGGADRDPGEVTLVAVSKTHPAAAIEAAVAAGQAVFGENRVQEAAGKYPALRDRHPALRLHLIGPLQTNKLRDALALFDMIETVDRPRLAEALARELPRAAERRGRAIELLIQVNTGEEPQKAGILPAAADGFIEECRARLKLPIRGLMCIPPAAEAPSLHFALLREIARRHDLPLLSMGMSGDFETAVRFGATHVRVGTAIFGHRPPPPQAELPQA
jgi:pyridoxal phosphate enzyme (YggS family)